MFTLISDSKAKGNGSTFRINLTLLVRAGALALGLASASVASAADTLKFGAGSAGGSWDGLAGALKGIIEDEMTDVTVQIRPGGAIVNAKAISDGKEDLAWLLATTSSDAIQGKGAFKKPLNQLCNLGSFHTTVMQVVTNDPMIKNLKDLRGKRISTTPRGNSAEAAARLVLKLEGISPDDIGQWNYVSLTDSANMMKDGHTDAWMLLSGIPSGAVMDLYSSTSHVRTLDLSDELLAKLRKKNGAWNRFVLKANTYPGQTQDRQIFGFRTHLGVNCTQMSDERAYQITKAIIKHYKEMGSVVNAISNLTLKDLVSDIGVPMHPGAIRAYKEAGVL